MSEAPIPESSPERSPEERSAAPEPPAPEPVEPALELAPAPSARARWLDRGVGALVGAALGAIAMGALQGSAPAVDEAEAEEPPPSDRVTMRPELARRAGIRVETVTAQPIVATTEVVGTVDFDPAAVSVVGARVQGRVSEVLVELGQEVHRGDALARVETADLGPALADWLTAEAELTAAHAHEARERDLATHRLTTATSVEQATASSDSLEARVRGTEQVLFAMGLTRAELERARAGRPVDAVTVRAPMDGEVIERPTTLGQVVGPTDAIVRIATVDTVWVNLDVYERDLDRVHEGDEVVLVGDGDEERSYTGRVEHVGPVVDESSRTAPVRIEVPNVDHELRPGQFVRAELFHEETARDGITVPTAAVMQLGGVPAVFVEVGDFAYEVRAVELGETVDDVVELRAGIVAGDRVVVEGGFALKSELQR
ncbi:MAG: efflux RND transporter periplasmic adaptor subunit [Sandaracinus sp.]